MERTCRCYAFPYFALSTFWYLPTVLADIWLSLNLWFLTFTGQQRCILALLSCIHLYYESEEHHANGANCGGSVKLSMCTSQIVLWAYTWISSVLKVRSCSDFIIIFNRQVSIKPVTWLHTLPENPLFFFLAFIQIMWLLCWSFNSNLAVFL